MAKNLASNFDKDKDGIKYQHPERTCKECILYPCFRGIARGTCDFAKYGCIKYRDKDE